MLKLLKPRTALERLRLKYMKLMRRSFETAKTDKEESDKIHKKASCILQEIRRLEAQ